jgi:hypothetical protein
MITFLPIHRWRQRREKKRFYFFYLLTPGLNLEALTLAMVFHESLGIKPSKFGYNAAAPTFVS